MIIIGVHCRSDLCQSTWIFRSLPGNCPAQIGGQLSATERLFNSRRSPERHGWRRHQSLVPPLRVPAETKPRSAVNGRMDLDLPPPPAETRQGSTRFCEPRSRPEERFIESERSVTPRFIPKRRVSTRASDFRFFTIVRSRDDFFPVAARIERLYGRHTAVVRSLNEEKCF